MLRYAELNWWGVEDGVVFQGPKVAGECLEENRGLGEAPAWHLGPLAFCP